MTEQLNDNVAARGCREEQAVTQSRVVVFKMRKMF